MASRIPSNNDSWFVAYRAAVKRKVILTTTLSALLLGGACLLSFHRAAPLPRIQFSDGGEFRVVQVTYTPFASESSDHAIGSAPRMQFWLWNHLPKALQAKVPYPNSGISYGLSDHPALSIWWAYIDPTTHKPEVGSTDYVITTLDSGERLNRIWSEPSEGHRQIFLTDPPRHSKRLHFQLGVEDHPVEFSIDNPAFTTRESQAGRSSGARQELRYFSPVELSVLSDVNYDQGSGAFAVQLPKSISVPKNAQEFEFEYSIVNLFNEDVFIVVEPKDNVAEGFSAFHGDETARTGELRYSLLPRPGEADGKRVTHSANRKALMSLRSPLESGGKFRPCIYIEGYFRDTGQPFYGSTYVDLPVAVTE
jgi:hypothetical protein